MKHTHYPLEKKSDFLTLYFGVVLILGLAAGFAKHLLPPLKPTVAPILFSDNQHFSAFKQDCWDLSSSIPYTETVDSLIKLHYRSGLGYDRLEFKNFVELFASGLHPAYGLKNAPVEKEPESFAFHELEILSRNIPLAEEAEQPHLAAELVTIIVYNFFSLSKLELFFLLTTLWTVFFGIKYGYRIFHLPDSSNQSQKKVVESCEAYNASSPMPFGKLLCSSTEQQLLDKTGQTFLDSPHFFQHNKSPPRIGSTGVYQQIILL